MNPCHLKKVLRACEDLRLKHWRVDRVRRKVTATKDVKPKWTDDWDDATRDGAEGAHQLHVRHATDPRVAGEYCRVVACRGTDRRGDPGRPDDWCEKFNVYEEADGAPIYVHALHKKLTLRRDRLPGGVRCWALVDASIDDERPHVLYAAVSDDACNTRTASEKAVLVSTAAAPPPQARRSRGARGASSRAGARARP